MTHSVQSTSGFEVAIHVGHDAVNATLSIPAQPRGLIVFAHGSGSSRFSSRNMAVASSLNDARFATLLLDLLTKREEAIDVLTAEFRFDIPRLADRLVGATDWAKTDQRTRLLAVGYFGASTGAAAALVAAAGRPGHVHAVVSRGGRPDLAREALGRVRAPTLLIVGERDSEVLELNRQAQRQMQAPALIEIVAGATHLFEEPGALERVAALATGWFQRYVAMPDQLGLARRDW